MVGGASRQVPGACWSRVKPELMPDTNIRLWSAEMAAELGIDLADADYLGGGNLPKGWIPMHSDTGVINLEHGQGNLEMAER